MEFFLGEAIGIVMWGVNIKNNIHEEEAGT
jgi:hypothetical protein